MRLNLNVTIQNRTDVSNEFSAWLYTTSYLSNRIDVFYSVILPWGNGSNMQSGIEGIPIEVWTASQTAERANKQPLGGEIVNRDYGISNAGITNLFFLQKSSAAVEGGRIVHGSNAYDIYRIEKYPNHCEAIVRPVVS